VNTLTCECGQTWEFEGGLEPPVEWNHYHGGNADVATVVDLWPPLTARECEYLVRPICKDVGKATERRVMEHRSSQLALLKKCLDEEEYDLLIKWVKRAS
jgi:hypothetical protein